MSRNGLQKFGESLFQGVLANALYAVGFGVAVTITSRYAPSWSHPVLLGLSACLIGLCILLALKAIRNLPPPTDRISTETIEENVRQWLYNTNLTVKREPSPETYFRFIVTLDSGWKIILSRLKNNWTEYIYFRADISSTEQQRKALETFDEHEISEVVAEMSIELSRAVMGHSPITKEGLSISKRIPITHSLNEDELIKVLWEMEAVVSMIIVTSSRAFAKHEWRLQNEAALPARFRSVEET